jgi:hypothetical protein
MQTLDKLKSGRLIGATKLTLSESLETFPVEIFDLADTLELLDLSRNRLDSLPEDFGRLKKLKILFLSENRFREVPKVLAQCPKLSMIGFKSNRIERIPEGALPPTTRWLILTDNILDILPDSIGTLGRLQKLMLAGNRLTSLPESMRHCSSLELLRLSANRLESLPDWLFAMPKLSWLACAGNPCMRTPLPSPQDLAEIAWEEVSLHEELGKGASGVISRATLTDERPAAIKIFKGSVTSDGYPSDEMAASMAAGSHGNLNTPHGKITDHPEAMEALVFPLIPAIYCNLGNPPSFETCTRDTYDEEASFPLPLLRRIASDVASAALHLHQRGINHGDLYAHNILVDKEGHSLLGDFGAATCYDRSEYGDRFEKLEVRAFGCLLDDLLTRSKIESEEEAQPMQELEALRDQCMSDVASARPSFERIVAILEQL